MEKREGFNVGEYHHLPLAAMVSHTLPHPCRIVLLDWPQGLGGGTGSPPQHCLLVSVSGGGSCRGQEIWPINHMGEPVSGQGPLYGGSSRETDCLGLQWAQLALHLWQLHEGTCHAPLPKEGHLGILPQRGVEKTPCGQISQLEVCQLLVGGPQVA